MSHVRCCYFAGRQIINSMPLAPWQADQSVCYAFDMRLQAVCCCLCCGSFCRHRNSETVRKQQTCFLSTRYGCCAWLSKAVISHPSYCANESTRDWSHVLYNKEAACTTLAACFKHPIGLGRLQHEVRYQQSSTWMVLSAAWQVAVASWTASSSMDTPTAAKLINWFSTFLQLSSTSAVQDMCFEQRVRAVLCCGVPCRAVLRQVQIFCAIDNHYVIMLMHLIINARHCKALLNCTTSHICRDCVVEVSLVQQNIVRSCTLTSHCRICNFLSALPVMIAASNLAYFVASSYSSCCTGSPLPH